MSIVMMPAADPANIFVTASLLRNGGIAVIPTDTVYGLAASIYQSEAIERVFQVKQRPPDKRVPVLLASALDLGSLVSEVPRVAWKLVDELWPGPLTLVLRAHDHCPRALSRGGDTIAVRVPAARRCLEMLQVLGEPVIGTSANVSGQPAAKTASEAAAQLEDKVDGILVDDEAIDSGLPSTVVEISGGTPVIHRVGAISVARIRDVLGTAVQVRRNPNAAQATNELVIVTRGESRGE